MHYRPSLIAAAILICTSHLSASSASPLEKLRKEHPRLLFTAADQDRIEKLAESEDLLARLIEQNRVNAEKMLAGARVRHEIPQTDDAPALEPPDDRDEPAGVRFLLPGSGTLR